MYIYKHMADEYHWLKDFESEKNLLKSVIDKHPNLNDYNKSKTGLNDRLENVEYYLKFGRFKWDCLPIDDDNIKSQIKQAKAHLNEGNKQKAINLLEEIIANGTYTNTAYNTLYQIYKKDEKYNDAIRICETAITELGLFSRDRLDKWTMNLERVTKLKSKNAMKKF